MQLWYKQISINTVDAIAAVALRRFMVAVLPFSRSFQFAPILRWNTPDTCLYVCVFICAQHVFLPFACFQFYFLGFNSPFFRIGVGGAFQCYYCFYKYIYNICLFVIFHSLPFLRRSLWLTLCSTSGHCFHLPCVDYFYELNNQVYVCTNDLRMSSTLGHFHHCHLFYCVCVSILLFCYCCWRRHQYYGLLLRLHPPLWRLELWFCFYPCTDVFLK